MSSSKADDLTTDACPSPPRDETEPTEKDDETKEENQNNHPKTSSTYKIPKSPRFSEIKRNTQQTAFASVTNISHSTNIHVGTNNVYNMYANKPNKPPKSKGEAVVTGTLKKLFKNQSPVTKPDLQIISAHMNEEWRDTARALQYSEGQISQFHENHKGAGIKEVIYQFLLDWIQNEPNTATVGKLANTLWDTNQQDVVQRWAREFK